jgi:hypothetical protein
MMYYNLSLFIEFLINVQLCKYIMLQATVITEIGYNILNESITLAYVT